MSNIIKVLIRNIIKVKKVPLKQLVISSHRCLKNQKNLKEKSLSQPNKFHPQGLTRLILHCREPGITRRQGRV